MVQVRARHDSNGPAIEVATRSLHQPYPFTSLELRIWRLNRRSTLMQQHSDSVSRHFCRRCPS